MGGNAVPLKFRKIKKGHWLADADRYWILNHGSPYWWGAKGRWAARCDSYEEAEQACNEHARLANQEIA